MHILLTGFMGCGKSTVGKALAARLERPFIDLDLSIEETAGMAVREIFERDGEASFRRLEAAALRGLPVSPAMVVATGGGTLAWQGNLEIAKEIGVSVWLNLPFDGILERLSDRSMRKRPLFGDREQARRLFEERLPVYRQADLQIEVTPTGSPGEVVDRLVILLREAGCDI